MSTTLIAITKKVLDLNEFITFFSTYKTMYDFEYESGCLSVGNDRNNVDAYLNDELIGAIYYKKSTHDSNFYKYYINLFDHDEEYEDDHHAYCENEECFRSAFVKYSNYVNFGVDALEAIKEQKEQIDLEKQKEILEQEIKEAIALEEDMGYADELKKKYNELTKK